jgi:hypothetical protein
VSLVGALEELLPFHGIEVAYFGHIPYGQGVPVRVVGIPIRGSNSCLRLPMHGSLRKLCGVRRQPAAYGESNGQSIWIE